jgi:hypothetical protein
VSPLTLVDAMININAGLIRKAQTYNGPNKREA